MFEVEQNVNLSGRPAQITYSKPVLWSIFFIRSGPQIWGNMADMADMAGDTAGYSGIQQDTAGYGRYSGIQRDTTGYSGIQRDTAGYSGIQQDTAVYFLKNSRARARVSE